MKAIDNSNLVNDLHYGPDSIGFTPKLTYQLVNTANSKIVQVTEASVFVAGDTLKKVLIHVNDVNGKSKHSEILLAGGASDKLDLTGLNLAGISFTATVITEKGLKADLGVYGLTGKSEIGDFAFVAKQGTRN